MKQFMIFVGLIASTFAAPAEVPAGSEGTVSVTQNSIGTYKYIVNLKDSSRTEERLADGTVTGEYTVPDVNGIPQTIRYIAGKEGFRILEGPLPIAPIDTGVAPLPVQETPEVIAARSAFPTLVVPVNSLPNLFAPGLVAHEVPTPVQDTPEVRAAKEAFFAAHREAVARLA